MVVRDPKGLIVLVILVVGAVVGLSMVISDNRKRSSTAGSSNSRRAVESMISLAPSPVAVDADTDADSSIPSSTMVPSSSFVPSIVPSDKLSYVPSIIPSDFVSPTPMASLPSTQPSTISPFFEPLLPYLPTLRVNMDTRRELRESN